MTVAAREYARHRRDRGTGRIRSEAAFNRAFPLRWRTRQGFAARRFRRLSTRTLALSWLASACWSARSRCSNLSDHSDNPSRQRRRIIRHPSATLGLV